MDKQNIVLGFIILISIVLLGFGLLFLRGFSISDGEVVVTSVVGGETERTQILTLDGESSFMSIAEADTKKERGLKSFETELVRKDLDELRIKFGQPSKEDACADDLPELSSYLEIRDGDREGVVYFCDGVGVDEVGNVVGPYQDLLTTLADLKIESAEN